MKRWPVLLALLPVLAAPAVPGQEEGEPPTPLPRPDWLLESDAAPAAPVSTPATQAITAATSAPQPVRVAARISDNGETVPDGLVWRVFDTTPDETGQLALVAKSEEAGPTLSLPPGEYVIHVAYGRAQVSDHLTVVPGDNRKDMVIDAGGLRLTAAVTGDVAIPVNLLQFDVYSGPEASRVLVAENLMANDTLTLNAGTYHVVSRFGGVNAVVRADLRVEPGQLTEAMLYHRASQVSFKLVSEEGGEAIADVEWTVRGLDGTSLYTEVGAFPSTVLLEGEYFVLAKQGETVFNRDFTVQPGAPREIEVLTTAF